MVNQLILETSLREDQFSDRQKKKKNMAIVHKKEDKNLLGKLLPNQLTTCL